LLLKLLYNNASLTDSNVETVLKLSDQFDFKTVVNKVENFLLVSPDLNQHTKLRLADQFNLGFLMETVLPRYKTINSIHELKMTEDYKELSEK
ncbi:hypothetical protein PFISCL1PPCAC_12243, partial [Pristionchus fissidentatus]